MEMKDLLCLWWCSPSSSILSPGQWSRWQPAEIRRISPNSFLPFSRYLFVTLADFVSWLFLNCDINFVSCNVVSILNISIIIICSPGNVTVGQKGTLTLGINGRSWSPQPLPVRVRLPRTTRRRSSPLLGQLFKVRLWANSQERTIEEILCW